MKMLIQCRNGLRRVQHEVRVSELHHYEGVHIALHFPLDRYDCWIASDLVTGQIITMSISKKLVLLKAKKRIKQHKEIFQKVQLNELTKLFNESLPMDYKLHERIQRKCVARGTTLVKSVQIVGGFADILYIQ